MWQHTSGFVLEMLVSTVALLTITFHDVNLFGVFCDSSRMYLLGCITTIGPIMKCLILSCLGILCMWLYMKRKSEKHFSNQSTFRGPQFL